MELFLRIGLQFLCYVLIALSILIFFTTVCRFVGEEKTPRKWILLSLIFVPIFLCSIGYTQNQRETVAVDWGSVNTYIGLGLCIPLLLLSFWILTNMYAFTLYAYVKGVDPLEKKNWHRNGLFYTCSLDGPPPKEPNEPVAPAKKLSYKDCATHYPDMAESRERIAHCLAEIEQSRGNMFRYDRATQDLTIQICKHGDPEYDPIPEHELIQQHASEVGTSLESEFLYLYHSLTMVQQGLKGIYEYNDRKVSSILRRRLGIATSIIEFKRDLAMNDPFVSLAWKDRLNSCDKIYTVKFYRVDGKPSLGIPMEEYEYMDDREGAEAHFDRFRNDGSLLYSHIDLTVVSSNAAEKVLKTIFFENKSNIGKPTIGG